MAITQPAMMAEAAEVPVKLFVYDREATML